MLVAAHKHHFHRHAHGAGRCRHTHVHTFQRRTVLYLDHNCGRRNMDGKERTRAALLILILVSLMHLELPCDLTS